MPRTPALVLPILAALPLGGGCAVDQPAIGEHAAEIVGGTLTTAYEAVPLLYAEFADGNAALCSGTLISERVVLTAAHCVEFAEAPVTHLAYFGTDVTVENDPNHLATIEVTEFTFHPNWNIDDLEGGHDIALVLLAEPGPVAPVGYNRQQLGGRDGENVHLVGWGRTSGEGSDYGKKREVMSTLQAHSNLLMQYGSAAANTCQGDSGGPNFMVQNSVEVVAGITSFGSVGCTEYGVGTNVANFASSYIDPWIAQKDPGGSCLTDGSCNQACGAVDADCPADGGDGSGGDSDGSGGEGDGSGGGAVEQGPITGGCAASGGAPGTAAGLLLLGLIAALRRRR